MVNYTYDILPGRICPWVLIVRKSIFTARQIVAEGNRKVHLQTTQGTDGGGNEGADPFLSPWEGLAVSRFYPTSPPRPLDYAVGTELPNATTDYLE